MTLQDIKDMDREMLTPAIVAPFLGCDQQTLRLQARHRPDLLGFPVVCLGTRVKIPRDAFVAFFEGKIPVQRKS